MRMEFQAFLQKIRTNTLTNIHTDLPSTLLSLWTRISSSFDWMSLVSHFFFFTIIICLSIFLLNEKLLRANNSLTTSIDKHFNDIAWTVRSVEMNEWMNFIFCNNQIECHQWSRDEVEYWLNTITNQLKFFCLFDTRAIANLHAEKNV